MNKPVQIGVTGGIGSGKSLVCRIFTCFGIPVYDADYRAKFIMTTDGILIAQIKKEFGDLSYDKEGRLNRSFLGDTVFSDPEKLHQLNSLVHPRVGVDFEQWLTANKKASYVIKEAALLFEAGSYKLLDQIIVVTAPEDLRIKRVLNRDKHRSKQQLTEIMNRQLPEAEKLKLADHVLINDETELLIPRVIELHQQFMNLCP